MVLVQIFTNSSQMTAHSKQSTDWNLLKNQITTLLQNGSICAGSLASLNAGISSPQNFEIRSGSTSYIKAGSKYDGLQVTAMKATPEAVAGSMVTWKLDIDANRRGRGQTEAPFNLIHYLNTIDRDADGRPDYCSPNERSMLTGDLSGIAGGNAGNAKINGSWKMIDVKMPGVLTAHNMVSFAKGSESNILGSAVIELQKQTGSNWNNALSGDWCGSDSVYTSLVTFAEASSSCSAEIQEGKYRIRARVEKHRGNLIRFQRGMYLFQSF